MSNDVLPSSGTPQRDSYNAGFKAAISGLPKKHPYFRLVSTRTYFLASWWERGWDDGEKSKRKES